MTFGESCRFKSRSHEPVSATDGREWHGGSFLSVDLRTGQYTIYGGEAIKMATTGMRLLDGNQWDKEALPKMNSNP